MSLSSLVIIAESVIQHDESAAQVKWMEELAKGGNTSIALGLLLLAFIGFAVERALRTRRDYICPDGFVEQVLPLWGQGKYQEILDICEKQGSVLAHMTSYIVTHRQVDPGLLIPGASDIASRELRIHTQKAFAIAVIASVAPLLGLLGTMIGMIESFNLVATYGDAGGASMLAGSISKALITTAAGLIIAIPALGVYHFFKQRINILGTQLEASFEVLINGWLLQSSQDSLAKTSNDAKKEKKEEA